MSNELGRLNQGFGEMEGNNTFLFIPKNKIPKEKIVTHIRIVCTMKQHKTEMSRLRITAGGNRIFDPREKINTHSIHRKNKNALEFCHVLRWCKKRDN